MKAEGRFSGMRKKLKRIFSLALIVVMLLSLIPVCEARTCDLAIGVGWGITYFPYETFKLKGDISSLETMPVSYDMTLTLYDPHGKKIDSWHFSGRLSRGEYEEHIVYKKPPEGGWEIGEYKICNHVIATGIGCTSNREVCTEITVKLPKPPDLVITDVWSDDSTIYYKIKNKGDKSAGASRTSLTIDDVFITSDYVRSLGAGKERTESFDYKYVCTNKSDKIKVCADFEDDVEEDDEGNNCRTGTWICKDLVISDIWSDNCTIYYKIENRGVGKVEASYTSLTIDDVFITSDYVAPLEPGEIRTESFNYSWACTNKSDEIKVCADYEDNVKEGNEENNCRTETWTCLPDLKITDVWSDNGTIYYKIRNAGNERAEESKTSLTIDDVFITSDYVPSLEACEERTESFNYTWICWNKSDEIKVCADYENDVEEKSETNNCLTETWTCPPVDIWVSPTSFDVRLPPDVVSNYTLTVGSTGTGVLKFNVGIEGGVSSQPGWPKTTGDSVFSSPALGDIDGDGDMEIVVGSWDNKVYAWHHDGSTVKGWPKKTGGGLGGVSSSPALGDMDKDGDLEVVVGSCDGYVYAWHHDGSTVKGWPKKTGGYVDSSPALGDIDGDGDMEIVVGSCDGYVYAWHHDGSTVKGWPNYYGSTSSGWPPVYSSPALGDIDGDGDIEIVVGSSDDNVYAWHHDGSTVEGWPKKTGGYVDSSPALGDIDGDGDMEIVVGSCDGYVYAWHHDGSTVKGWPRKTAGAQSSSPALGDIDGDGDLEVVVGSGYDGKEVYAWHHDGSTVKGWPKKTGGETYSSPALGDIDGDGDIEVVIGSGYDEGHRVYAWHHDGSTVKGWPKKTGGYVVSSPALGDIDGDGDIEVVVGSYDDKVYVWDSSGPCIYGPNNIEWGTFHHDVRRTGFYEAKKQKRVCWLSSIYPTEGIIVPDSQTNITVIFNTTGIPPGKFYANIAITSNDPDESSLSIPVKLRVTIPQPGSIQYAVDAASPGDTIIVKDGTYTENVYVNKRLTIISENGSANCTVQAAKRNEDVFHIAADYVNISGFTIRGAYDAAGIRIESDFCNVSNNICSNNDNGISLSNSNKNIITNNICSYSIAGIYIRYSNNNTISNNNCSKNKFGITIDFSNNNAITNNNCSYNDWDGIDLYKSDNSEITNNNCSYNRFDGIDLSNSNNNSIINNNCSYNRFGIYLSNSNNNKITNNNCSYNDDEGIRLWYNSNENIITNNNICSNDDKGILLYESSNDNKIYLNNFLNNRDNVHSYASTNIWDSTEKIKYTYKGSEFENYLGNYWSDYTGSDTDGDGIGDTPYSIGRDKDNYPLMKPFENYIIAPELAIFDTGKPSNPYPSIAGTHNGTIKPNKIIEVSKLYTYPCAGTGGHVEYARIYNDSWSIETLPWEGYGGDWHNLSFTEPFKLYANVEYKFTIRTGSYPQIHHKSALPTENGWINCTEFIDANGKIHYDWIPAIKLW